VTFKIKDDVSKEKLHELMQLAQKLSSVFDIVLPPTPVEVSLEDKII